MSSTISLKKGLDIKLLGVAEQKLDQAPLAAKYAVRPTDFEGVTPKLLVKPDDTVRAGTPLFFDKYHPELLFTSPVSGTVEEIVRGEKRKILEVVVKPDSKIEYEEFPLENLETISRERVIELLLRSGMWPLILQRPYGIIANSKQTPRAIFISGFDSAPLAPETEFLLQNREKDLRNGLKIMRKLSGGEVHLSLDSTRKNQLFSGLEELVTIHYFNGKHPAGNVGVQIHHISPIGKGDLIWTINSQDLALIGRFFSSGKADFSKIIALTGSEVVSAHYYAITAGAQVSSILLHPNITPQPEGQTVRIIDGNVLTGRKVAHDNYVGFYTNQLTVIPEGNKHEFLGWIAPRLNKFSVSRSYLSWLTPHKKYVLDTNLNGGHRALVVTGLYEKYLPMDIYPIYLIKAILAEDIDKMENLGIYEIIEEDLALCEFVDPSKTEMQAILRKGINLMIKEMN